MRAKTMLVLAGVGIVLAFPFVASNSYELRLVSMMAINALAVIGLNLVKGYAGQISVGQHGLFGVGAYASAVLSTTFGWPVWLSIPAAMVISGFAGLIVGLPSLRVQGAYLAIATLSFAESFRIAVNSWKWAGGSLGISHVPPLSIGSFVFDSPRAFYYVIMVVAGVGIWIAFNLVRSDFGRTLLAIREDALAANVSGINISRYKLIAFLLSAAYAGLAGALQAHITGFVHPDNFTLLLMLMFMLMLVVGGMGSIGGSIAGAIVVTLLFDLSRSFVQIQMMIFATVLILTLRYLPGGLASLVPLVRGWVLRLRNRPRGVVRSQL